MTASKNHLYPSRSLMLLAAWAIAGQLIFAVSALFLPIWSEYGLIGDNISELVLGRYGFVQTAALVLVGVGSLGLAFTIGELTRGSWGSRVGSLLLAVYGGGAILSAVFPTDRIDSPADLSSLTTTGTMHVLVFLVSFLSVTIGMFILTRTFARDDKWKSFSRWAVLFPVGAVLLSLVQSESATVGLMQRLLIAMPSAWLILVAFKVRSIVLIRDADAAAVEYTADDPTATRRRPRKLVR